MEESVEKYLGKKVRDIVSGYQGTVIGVSIYTYDYPLALVASVDPNGHPVECWFKIGRLEIIY